MIRSEPYRGCRWDIIVLPTSSMRIPIETIEIHAPEIVP